MPPLWIDFINSDARDPLGHGRDEDRLTDPQWLDKFLQRWDLPRIGTRRPEHRAALLDLRAVLQRFVATIVAGQGLSASDLDELNRRLGSQPVRPNLTRDERAYRLHLAPTTRGIQAVVFAIAASFAEFLTEGDPSRLKTCDNPDCRWVFYDITRSRTRRWCAESCGNLIKVRQFRERRKTR